MEVLVGIGEYRVAAAPATVITRGLGSCVGVTLYSRSSQVGGLAHVMLPNSQDFKTYNNPYKFADLAVRALFQEIFHLSKASRLEAKLVGGAKMFTFKTEGAGFDIGYRNLEQVRSALSELGVQVVAEDVGGSWGRTAILDLHTGRVLVKTVGKGEQVL